MESPLRHVKSETEDPTICLFYSYPRPSHLPTKFLDPDRMFYLSTIDVQILRVVGPISHSPPVRHPHLHIMTSGKTPSKKFHAGPFFLGGGGRRVVTDRFFLSLGMSSAHAHVVCRLHFGFDFDNRSGTWAPKGCLFRFPEPIFLSLVFRII